jgi:hypothetical protein
MGFRYEPCDDRRAGAVGGRFLTSPDQARLRDTDPNRAHGVDQHNPVPIQVAASVGREADGLLEVLPGPPRWSSPRRICIRKRRPTSRKKATRSAVLAHRSLGRKSICAVPGALGGMSGGAYRSTVKLDRLRHAWTVARHPPGLPGARPLDNRSFTDAA